jgi:hypothetical protein
MQVDNIVIADYILQYSNRFDSSAINQNDVYSLNGALIAERSAKQAGLPIILKSGNTGLNRSVLEQLKAHADSLPGDFTLTLTTGESFTVNWDYKDGSPVTGQPVWRDDSEPSDQFITNITLKFLTV